MFAASTTEAIREIEALEVEARRLEARRAQLFRRLEATQVFRGDGHGTAKTMLRHVGQLSGPSAARWQRIGRVTRELPLIADALSQASIGVDQVDLLGRVHANRRVRAFMVDAQEWFVGWVNDRPGLIPETGNSNWTFCARCRSDNLQPNRTRKPGGAVSRKYARNFSKPMDSIPLKSGPSAFLIKCMGWSW